MASVVINFETREIEFYLKGKIKSNVQFQQDFESDNYLNIAEKACKIRAYRNTNTGYAGFMYEDEVIGQLFFHKSFLDSNEFNQLKNSQSEVWLV